MVAIAQPRCQVWTEFFLCQASFGPNLVLTRRVSKVVAGRSPGTRYLPVAILAPTPCVASAMDRQ
jgi:hypothetical protein